MVSDALVAWLHFVSIFGLVASLAVELVLYRQTLTLEAARRLGTWDRLFGLFALAVLLTGLARVLWFGKGVDFYLSNPLFIAKVAVFLLAALISILPTVQFLRWRGDLRAGRAPTMDAGTYRRNRMCMHLEAALLLLLPLLAALMARGIGA